MKDECHPTLKDLFTDIISILFGAAAEVEGLSSGCCHERIVLGLVAFLDSFRD